MKETKTLVDAIIKGIQEKKGSDIAVIDLGSMEGAICKNFVVCQGYSPSQVDAIADSVEEFARKEAGDKPIKVIGRENAIWVAMDYSDVIVHIFVPDAREFYSLEHLWEDAPITLIPNLD